MTTSNIRTLHPDEVIDPKDLTIGKRIRCHYQAKSNEVGVFSGLGEGTSDFIPPESSAEPSGDFYFICVDRDHLGRWKLIADRNIQHSISWDTLNSEGIASGSGLTLDYLAENYILQDGKLLNYDIKENVSYLSSIVFNNELYVFTSEATDGGLNKRLLRVKKFNGTKWVDASDGESLNFDPNGNPGQCFPVVFNGELCVFWSEWSNRSILRAKKLVKNKWINLGSPLNYDPTMHSEIKSVCVYNNILYIFFRENKRLRFKKYDGIYWHQDDGVRLNSFEANAFVDSIVFNDELYLFWNERNNNQTSITRGKKLSGGSWKTADFSSPLNLDTEKHTFRPKLVVYKNELYVFFIDEFMEGSQSLVCKKLSGNQWKLLSDSLNYNSNRNSIQEIKTYVYNDRLYVFWRERSDKENEGYVIRGKILNGESFVPINSRDIHSLKGARPFDLVEFNGVMHIQLTSNDNLDGKYLLKDFSIDYTMDKSFTVTSRLLTGGISTGNKDNEWDKYIVNSDLNGTIEAGDNNVWNWKNVFSWTSTSDHNGLRVIRGRTSVESRASSNSSIVASRAFRPVLLIEPKNKNKSFILYEGEAYYYNSGWVNLGAIPDDTEAKKQLFEQYGMEHDITGRQLKELKEMLLG
ncbi:hypothetical protein [Bacillus chungangensis]|uniref:Uncharacterized protein n=1 Tax=Bacillus chungangensis TaxID=587633 RepID=A0ABT9WTY0_9BACI|nr:hypothetical protein [Bacillus chungangensis]MDQ0176743.1 hypothetical protein [Bacillus chungangensis]